MVRRSKRGINEPRVSKAPHTLPRNGMLMKLRVWALRNISSLVGYMPPHLSLSARMRRILRSTRLGWWWEFVQLLTTLVSCSVYVYSTYRTLSEWLVDPTVQVLEWITTILFVTDIIFRWIASENPATYVFQPSPLIDLVQVIPTFAMLVLRGQLSSISLLLMRIFRIVRVFRILRAFQLIQSFRSVVKQGMRVAIVIFSLVFILAGIIQLTEVELSDLMGHPERATMENKLDFGSAFYFGIVTVATVGYGDYFATTELGKSVVSIFIIICIFVVPNEINRFAELMTFVSHYRTPVKRPLWKTDDPPHIVVVGATSSHSALRNFLAQFYHIRNVRYDMNASSPPKIVIMGSNEPSSEIKELIIDAALDERVIYYKGSVLLEADMYAIGVDVASAIFVISDSRGASCCKDSKQLHNHADRSASLCYVMARSLAPCADIFICMNMPLALGIISAPELLRPTKQIGSWPRTEAVVLDEWTIKMCAMATVFPGFPSLVSNLTSASLAPRHLPAGTPAWLSAHCHGSSSRLVAFPLPAAFDGYSFTSAASVFYSFSDGGCSLWGVCSPPVPEIDWALFGTKRPVVNRRNFSSQNVNLSIVRGEPWSYSGDLLPGSAEAIHFGPPVTERQPANAGNVSMPQASRMSTLSDNSMSSRSQHPIGSARPPPLSSVSGKNLFVPSDFSFNPGPAYRLRAGEIVVALISDDTWLPTILDAKTWLHFTFPQSVSPIPRSSDGVAPNYGFPADYENDSWTWGQHAFVHSRAWQDFFRDYDPRPHSAQPATRQSKRDFTMTPARQRALEVWGRLANHIRNRVRDLARKRPHRALTKKEETKHNATKARTARRKREILFRDALDSGDDGRTDRSGGLWPGAGDLEMPAEGSVDPDILVSPFAYVNRHLLVKDVRTDCGEPGGPVGHIIIAVKTSGPCAHVLQQLRADYMPKTSLSKMIVFLLQEFVDDENSREAVLEMRLRDTCAIVIGSPIVPADLLRAGIATASCLLLLDIVLPADATESPVADAPQSADDSGFPEAVSEFEDSTRLFSYILVERALASVDTSPRLRLLTAVNQTELISSYDAQRRRFNELGAAAIGGRAESAGHFLRQRRAEQHSQEGGGARHDLHTHFVDPLVEGILGHEGNAQLHTSAGETTARSAISGHSLWSADSQARFLPSFVSGNIISRTMASANCVTSYFNPTAIRVVEHMIASDPDLGSTMIVEPLPRRFHGRTFGQLREDLNLDPRYRAPIPFALYRPQKAVLAPLDAFILHPAPSTILYSTASGEDLVYFFALQPVWLGPHACAAGELDPMIEALYFTSTPINPGHEKEMHHRREAVKAERCGAEPPSSRAAAASSSSSVGGDPRTERSTSAKPDLASPPKSLTEIVSPPPNDDFGLLMLDVRAKAAAAMSASPFGLGASKRSAAAPATRGASVSKKSSPAVMAAVSMRASKVVNEDEPEESTQRAASKLDAGRQPVARRAPLVASPSPSPSSMQPLERGTDSPSSVPSRYATSDTDASVARRSVSRGQAVERSKLGDTSPSATSAQEDENVKASARARRKSFALDELARSLGGPGSSRRAPSRAASRAVSRAQTPEESIST